MGPAAADPPAANPPAKTEASSSRKTETPPADAGPAATPQDHAAKPGGGSDTATPATPGVPVKPGSVRVTTTSPDPDKWEGLRSANGLQRVFKCKPLACSDAEVVSFVFSKSPTRHPDPIALDKLAKIELPKSMRALDAQRKILSDGAEKIETLESKTATLKGYPAVVNETKFSSGKVSVYLNTAIIFAGPAMIRIQSTSRGRELSQKSLGEFVNAMRIEEGAPLRSGSPVPTTGREEQL